MNRYIRTRYEYGIQIDEIEVSPQTMWFAANEWKTNILLFADNRIGILIPTSFGLTKIIASSPGVSPRYCDDTEYVAWVMKDSRIDETG